MQSPIPLDPTLSVFISDIHVSGKNIQSQPTYQNPLFEKVVQQVLAMNPRPKNVLIFGDLALWYGWSTDYEESKPLIQRIKEAGIQVYLTTGNHDHRELLFRYYPYQKEITPVPGRFVSVIDLGTADFVLFDTLQETSTDEGTGNAVSGELDAVQAEWLLSFAASAKRPFFFGAHHPLQELVYQDTHFYKHLEGNPFFCGYIHGHDHMWYTQWNTFGFSQKHVLRSACLPSTGWWGNIGFATFRTTADHAVLSLVQNDFFFPAPLSKEQARPAEWDCIISELKDATCTFPYPPVQAP